MTDPDDHLGWPDSLEDLIEGLTTFERVVVLSETSSTQDAARRDYLGSGSVFVAGRQTAGRGRQGRNWADDLGKGVAMTLVVPWEDSEYLCARAAIAVARALVPRLEEARIHAGVKWPNDVVMFAQGMRKIAGILVEGHEESALVGIGVNVHDREWPMELATTASSLEAAGLSLTRLDVVEQILIEWEAVHSMSRSELQQAYARHDMLTGSVATIQENQTRFSGTVRGVDPFSGIELDTTSGLKRIDPQLAQVIDWHLPDGLQMDPERGR
ncbi:MAG: biotin--[acetyl-CoA-carboxylase] ligase [Planctomycetes bacterium TMED75]|nr:biotin--[acetyl-CoA-carboxylase] ligase [Planctomycetaceae bacterium]OUU90458.1 MAG: biotin--[acetyl-CoA-carboxylase] ligase [Planctomycetes bacterium TMED75]